MDGFGVPDTTVVVVAGTAALTTWLVVLELAAKLALARKLAVMVCVPTVRVEIGSVALPVPSRVTVPRSVVPSLKSTLPVGVPAPEVTVPVKVPALPTRRCLGLPETVVLVVAGAAALTTWLVVLELAAKLALARKLAVMV